MILSYNVKPLFHIFIPLTLIILFEFAKSLRNMIWPINSDGDPVYDFLLKSAVLWHDFDSEITKLSNYEN